MFLSLLPTKTEEIMTRPKWKYARCHDCGKHRKVVQHGAGILSAWLCTPCVRRMDEALRTWAPFSQDLEEQERQVKEAHG